MNLFRRIFLSHLIVLLIAILLLSVLLTIVVEKIFYQQKVRDLKELGTPITKQIGEEQQTNLIWLKRLGQILQKNKIYLAVIDENNRPLYQSQSLKKQGWLPDDVFEQIKKGEWIEGKRKLLKKEVTWVVIPRGETGNKGAVILYSPVDGIVKAIRQTRIALLIAAVVSLLVALITSAWFSRHIVIRVQKLIRVTNQIRAGNYEARVRSNEKSEDEITILGHHLDLMAAQLEYSQRQLGLFEQRRQQFILDLSHELRTPLTSIRGWLEALQKDYVDEAQKSKVYANMEQETMRLIRLIQELMDLEKIRAGKVELKKEVHLVRDLFELVADQCTWMAEEKHLSIQIQLPEDQEVVVVGDYDRLLQILVNLVKNGIQFTSAGSITLSAYQKDQETVIQIRDTGIGMKEEDLAHIWDRFFKVDPSRARAGGETGLGLAIVKQLVEAHGGSITVESELQKGTCFTIVLPLSHLSHQNASVLS